MRAILFLVVLLAACSPISSTVPPSAIASPTEAPVVIPSASPDALVAEVRTHILATLGALDEQREKMGRRAQDAMWSEFILGLRELQRIAEAEQSWLDALPSSLADREPIAIYRLRLASFIGLNRSAIAAAEAVPESDPAPVTEAAEALTLILEVRPQIVVMD